MESTRVTHHPGLPIQNLRSFQDTGVTFGAHTKRALGTSGWLVSLGLLCLTACKEQLLIVSPLDSEIWIGENWTTFLQTFVSQLPLNYVDNEP